MKPHGQKLEPGMWAPGKDVAIREGILYCRLDFERSYPLVEESAGFLETLFPLARPHLDFLQVSDESGLVQFVKSWGPIVMNPEERVTGECALRLGQYWLAHRYLTRVVDLLAAFRRGSGESYGLGRFLELRSISLNVVKAEAEVRGWRVPEDAEYLRWLNSFFDTVSKLPMVRDDIGMRTGEEEQIAKMLETAPLTYVRRLLDHTISSWFPVSIVSQPIRPKSAGKRRTLVPRIHAEELVKLLEYRIFLDEWSDHPLHKCDECGRLFRSETRHRRRYCGPDCANRVSSREYKRAIRAKQKRDGTRRKAK